MGPWLTSIRGASSSVAAAAVRRAAPAFGTDGDLAAMTATFLEVAAALRADPRVQQQAVPEPPVEALADALRRFGPAGGARALEVIEAAKRRRAEPDGAAVDLLWRDPGHPQGARWIGVLAAVIVEERRGARGARWVPGPRDEIAEATTAVTSPHRAFGTWTSTLHSLAWLGDPRSTLDPTHNASATDMEIRVINRRGTEVGGVIPALDGETIVEIQRALQGALGVPGLRLLRFVITRVQRQDADQDHRGNPRDVRVKGGWSALANTLGGLNPARLKSAAELLQRLRVKTPSAEVGGLLTTYEARRGRSGGRRVLTVTAGLVLSPEFRAVGDVLAPVPDPAREPPMHGSGGTYAAQLRLQQLWLLEMRRGWKQLIDKGGLILQEPARCWEPLAERAGLPQKSLQGVLDLWRAGEDDTPPFLEVDGDVWRLGAFWKPEWEFLLEGAQASRVGSIRRKKRK